MPELLTSSLPVAKTSPLSGLFAQRWLLVVGVMLLMLGCFSVIEHDTIFANAGIKALSEADIRDEFIDQIENGSSLRKVGLISFALFGGVALLLSKDRRWNPAWSVATPLLLLTLVVYASVLWSGAPALTLRRLVVLGCVLLGCAGLARVLKPSELLFTALVTLAVFIGGAFAIEIALGGRPWQGGEYRFGGTLHPNAQATYCGVLCLAALVQPISFGRRWVLRSLLVIGLGLLLLTQSRTGLIALAVAGVSVWTLRLPSLFRWAGVGMVLAGLAAGVVAWNSIDDGLRNRTVNAVLLGRTEQAKSLTGRVPLWEELLGDIARRPVLGYGYDGFWTPDRIAAITKSQNWTLQNAHNSYLEVVLQVGVVGLVLAVWLLLAAVRESIRAYDLTRQPGYAFVFAMLVFGMTNSLLESLFVKLRYTPALCLLGILSIALFFPAESAWAQEQEADDDQSPPPPYDLVRPGDRALPAIPR